MRFILISLAIMTLVVARGSVVIAKQDGPELSIDAAIDPTPQTALVNEQQVRHVIFSLQRKTDKPVSGRILLKYPIVLDSNGKTESIDFDLSKQTTVEVTARVVIQKDVAPGKYSFPVTVLVQGKTYVNMDLLVTKSISWHYIGPFEGGPTTAHDRAFEPERKLDISKRCMDMKGRELSWKPFPGESISADGMFFFSGPFPNIENATAYATTNVYSDLETKARLLVGSDDSIKIWQNGTLIHSNNILRGSAPGQDKIDITLTKGRNVFLVKVCQEGGEWGFHFDIDDGTGKPVQGLKHDIVVTRGFITDPVLRLSNVTQTGASIVWKSDVPTTSKITICPAQPGRALPVYGETPKSAMVKAAAGVKPVVYEDNTYTCDHSFSFEGVKPGTRYLVSVSPAIGGQDSEPLAFYTAPPAGKTMYVKLKMVNLIFTNVVPEKDSKLPGADSPASQALIDQMKTQCEEASMFYWINSGMRFYLENEYFVCDTFLTDGDDSWYGVGYDKGEPDEKLLKEVLDANGKKLSDYDGRNFITIERRWDPVAKKWFLPASGGGTIGPEAAPGYGKSAWKAGSPNAWMYVHECGHQFDALYSWSMGPEFIFNHPQPWDGTAHRTGDHYDANAYILWDWAGYVNDQHQGRPFLDPTKWFRYFTNRWGTVEIVDDNDGDGIPDNDPRIPLDEVRWKSNPTKKDTDNDGLNDLQEAMACQWVDYGNGETWGGPMEKHRCNPRNPDTDTDGIMDGKDDYPIYPVDPNIRIKTPAVDGIIKNGEYAPFASLRDEAIKMDFYLAWDDNNLYVAGKSDKVPAEYKVLLDLDDNGWYFGHDNYHLMGNPSGALRLGDEWHFNADKSFAAVFHNCGVPNKWPFYDGTGLKDGEIKFAQSKENGYSFEVAIPRNLDNGLKLESGEKIGIVFGVLPYAGFERHWSRGPLTPFECHTRFTFTLAGK